MEPLIKSGRFDEIIGYITSKSESRELRDQLWGFVVIKIAPSQIQEFIDLVMFFEESAVQELFRNPDTHILFLITQKFEDSDLKLSQ